jgi:hypothetical protein
LSFEGALQYALDIHPFTNIAVIADTANGRVLFVPYATLEGAGQLGDDPSASQRGYRKELTG